ncbi:hypothetical protein [Photorhabdus sp. CRCIA-P01]|uniref:hypothetical protein n=1 Tax=Photorhabdus sp. CRCIA-P01 TaxID=2019570 RepID=UPI00130037A7|nr:hypothetical protein [Photorhabdus sp. CRCIA-P01]
MRARNISKLELIDNAEISALIEFFLRILQADTVLSGISVKLLAAMLRDNHLCWKYEM